MRTATKTFSSIRSQGFTLIELTVVLAIVSILAAIVFAVVGNITQSARSIQSFSNLRNYVNCAYLYKSETGYLAPHRMGDESTGTRLYFFQYFVKHYLDMNPEAARSPFDDWDTLENSWPIPGTDNRVKISYGRNGEYPLLPTEALALSRDQGKGYNLSAYYPPNEGKILFPSDTAYFFESNVSRVDQPEGDTTINFHHKDGQAAAVSFMDGSVRLVYKADLYGTEESEPAWSEERRSKFWTGRVPD